LEYGNFLPLSRKAYFWSKAISSLLYLFTALEFSSQAIPEKIASDFVALHQKN
jgi:hypothetical protein